MIIEIWSIAKLILFFVYKFWIGKSLETLCFTYWGNSIVLYLAVCAIR